MYIPEEMKINKFKAVNLPKNRDYFARLGQFTPPVSQYTGDEVAPFDQDKIDSVVDYLEYVEQQANESKK